ncbi:MAG: hypothetical protein LBP59_13170 [Planctomycetaceae bacterium]|jgi:hypothetical protein|nr:hypothetical protein [Planctomycetaceae bacterium]
MSIRLLLKNKNEIQNYRIQNIELDFSLQKIVSNIPLVPNVHQYILFMFILIVIEFQRCILLVLEIQRFKSVKACRPKTRQAKVNRKLKYGQFKIRICDSRYAGGQIQS